MFSDNIIDRHNALAELLSLNFTTVYPLTIIALGLVCWRLKNWL